MKILFYCHNVFGLGHIVRSLRIAGYVFDYGQCECTIMTGCRFLDSLSFDERIRVEKLPSAQMISGRFRAVDPLNGDVIKIRSQHIFEFVRKWKPSVVVIDHLGLGLGGELMKTLLAAHREDWNTRFIWGLRDINVSPDRPSPILNPPKNPKIKQALERINCAIVYSDPAWIDTLWYYKKFPMPEKIEFMGIVTSPVFNMKRLKSAAPLLVALAGGGTGGDALFTVLLEAWNSGAFPKGLKLRIVAGPFGKADALLKMIDNNNTNVEIRQRGSVSEAVQQASLVVSRVGYNTAYTLVQTDLPIIFVPFISTEGEQHYRARRLSELANVWMVDEKMTNFKTDLIEQINRGLKAEHLPRSLPFQVEGAKKSAEFLVKEAQKIIS